MRADEREEMEEWVVKVSHGRSMGEGTVSG